MVSRTYLPELARHLKIKTDAVRLVPGPRFHIELACSGCRQPVGFTLNKPVPPDFAARKVLQAGWTIKPILCPACSADRAAIPANDEKENTVNKPKLEAVPDLPAKSVDARAAQRQALTWLDNFFDVASGQYREGVTDRSIALETDLAVAKVAALREEFYGSLKAPPEWVALQGEVASLRAGADAIEKDFKQVCSEIRASADRLDAKLTDAARKGGWAV